MSVVGGLKGCDILTDGWKILKEGEGIEVMTTVNEGWMKGGRSDVHCGWLVLDARL